MRRLLLKRRRFLERQCHWQFHSAIQSRSINYCCFDSAFSDKIRNGKNRTQTWHSRLFSKKRDVDKATSACLCNWTQKCILQRKKNISIQSLKNDFTFYRQLRLLDFLFSFNCFKNHKNGNFLTKTNLTRLSAHSRRKIKLFLEAKAACVKTILIRIYSMPGF